MFKSFVHDKSGANMSIFYWFVKKIYGLIDGWYIVTTTDTRLFRMEGYYINK